MADKLEDIGEAIQLASQADLAAKEEDDDFKKFEDLFLQLQIQQRLLLEGQVRRGKFAHLRDSEGIESPQDLVEKTLQVTLKSEEASQLHLVCQKAIETCQLSLGLQAAEGPNSLLEEEEEELLRSSIEYMDVNMENLRLCQQLGNMNHELSKLHGDIAKAQRDISELKANPQAAAGDSKNERIKKLQAQLDTSSGRYNFTRFLTQLLLMASEEDLNNPKIADLFVKCGQGVDD